MGRGRLDALTERAQQLGAAGLVWMRTQDHGWPRLAGGEVPLGGRAALRRRRARRRARATCCCSLPAPGGASTPCSVSCASTSAARPYRRVASSSCGSSTSRCSRGSTVRGVRSRPTIRSRCRTPTISGWLTTATDDELLRDPLAVVRPRRQRLGARFGQRPNPFLRRATAGVHAARDHARAGAFPLRVPARRVPVRRAAARRIRDWIDRFTAVLAGEENIREVTAFPKTQSGADPLTGAPRPPRPGPAHRAGSRSPQTPPVLRPRRVGSETSALRQVSDPSPRRWLNRHTTAPVCGHVPRSCDRNVCCASTRARHARASPRVRLHRRGHPAPCRGRLVAARGGMRSICSTEPHEHGSRRRWQQCSRLVPRRWLRTQQPAFCGGCPTLLHEVTLRSQHASPAPRSTARRSGAPHHEIPRD